MRNRIIQNIVFIVLIIVLISIALMVKNKVIILGGLAILPYILVSICVWLFLSLNMLRNGMKNLHEVPTEKRIEMFTKMLTKTFAAETFIGKDSLIDTYRYVINLKQINYHAKVKLYEAFERKCINVPYPSLPKKTGREFKL